MHLEILDLVAGLIFIYFLLSLVCNSVFESISALRGIRGKLLEDWLKKTFDDAANKTELSGHFLDNRLLDGLSKEGKATAYMRAGDFSTALFSLIARLSKKVPETIAEIETALTNFNTHGHEKFPADLQHALLVYVAQAKATVENENQKVQLFKTNIENWFDSMMQRVGGKYKRVSMRWTFIISLTVTVCLNVDTVSISRYLYSNKEAREKLALAAYSDAHDSSEEKKIDELRSTLAKRDSGSAPANLDSIINNVTARMKSAKELNAKLNDFLPLGWTTPEYKIFVKQHGDKQNFGNTLLFCLSKLFGLLLTIFAVMLGAPFWYDVLGKVANIRSSLKPATSEEEKNKK